jgi:hypothetical protein
MMDKSSSTMNNQKATQIDDYLQALGTNQASPEVTEWTLQGQIQARYLEYLPPAQSQDTSFQIKQ